MNYAIRTIYDYLNALQNLNENNGRNMDSEYYIPVSPSRVSIKADSITSSAASALNKALYEAGCVNVKQTSRGIKVKITEKGILLRDMLYKIWKTETKGYIYK